MACMAVVVNGVVTYFVRGALSGAVTGVKCT